ncbi:hypothetical protein [Halorarum salinum]|uniref:DUF8113 domain-containing protein n=1 Tax=Halorarum salinum TaxID=2743089 RepID=A0A7D5Q971_9EURY|nr:hypothetical protein [Halobaculum salinum]QLG61556.1 hypothetical protein HUG12_07375 [Halobaculum salinum]
MSDEDADGSTFERELENARTLLEADDVTAVHVGVVHGEEVDTAFAQTADDPHEEGLRALTLLATHLRLVAEEAGVDYETVAADAASLAGSVEELPDVGDRDAESVGDSEREG